MLLRLKARTCRSALRNELELDRPAADSRARRAFPATYYFCSRSLRPGNEHHPTNKTSGPLLQARRDRHQPHDRREHPPHAQRREHQPAFYGAPRDGRARGSVEFLLLAGGH